ncbi:uncharacterized protein LOC142237306 [Haematobia irritans]|uniref:uncharacterized protein LOC142237306 n=1 Tax=Haematobia irritans TaxID=7368 RepID=UPI003F4F89E6
MPPNNEPCIFNPNANLPIPLWINDEYFREIVAKDEKDSVGIRKLTPTAALPPAENFTSVMVRIHLELEMRDGSIKPKSYILKTMLDEDKGGAVFNKLPLFPKEMKMYRTYLPAFEKLYKAAGCDIQLAPRCLFTEKVGNRINFVFEDLAQKNFKNLDRLKGCDMKHLYQTLRKLAEFHAASVVYETQQGPYEEDFQYGFVDNRQGPGFCQMVFENCAPSLKKAMANWNMENTEECLKKFPSSEQFSKCALATLQQSTNSFNVLNHGDFWSSNIMFNYLPNGDINETLMVDFQICKWGSPAEDLLFFLTLSPSYDIRIKEFDHCVEIYHTRLIECLKLLDYKKPLPSLRALHQDMYDKKNSFYAFFACVNHLPLLLLPTDKDCNVLNFSTPDQLGEEFRRKVFSQPLFVETIKKVYPFFYRRGLFNFEDYD